jgi:predicted nucleic acid-binding protein
VARIIVIDSGILIASVLQESYTQQAEDLLVRCKTERIKLVAPTLFAYEIVASIRKAAYRNRISQERSTALQENLLGFAVQLYFDQKLLKRALELATKLNRPTAYDAQYLALAERLNCNFWTTDEKLFNATHLTLKYVQWIGDFQPGSPL